MVNGELCVVVCQDCVFLTTKMRELLANNLGKRWVIHFCHQVLSQGMKPQTEQQGQGRLLLPLLIGVVLGQRKSYRHVPAA